MLSLETGHCEAVPYEDRARATCQDWMQSPVGTSRSAMLQVLEPRLPALRRVFESLDCYRRRNSPSHGYTVFVDDLHEMYALSRLHQLTLQPASGQAPGLDEVSEEQRVFWLQLGLEEEARREFSPLFHEIVQVTRDDSLSWPLIERELWPCLRLGELVLARGGIHIRAPHRLIEKGLAESSTLFWAWWHQRAHEDLSHGWGSNSQWRTSFRRDYGEAGAASELWFFNVDAGGVREGCPVHELESAQVDGLHYFAEIGRPWSDNLPVEARREVLWHRCRVRSPEPSELWIYDDACAMRAGRECI